MFPTARMNSVTPSFPSAQCQPLAPVIFIQQFVPGYFGHHPKILIFLLAVCGKQAPRHCWYGMLVAGGGRRKACYEILSHCTSYLYTLTLHPD